jgi:hypothetical protein
MMAVIIMYELGIVDRIEVNLATRSVSHRSFPNHALEPLPHTTTWYQSF